MKPTFRCLQARELKQIILEDRHAEPMVALDDMETSIICRHTRRGMLAPSKILVRQTVAAKLQEVQAKLTQKFPQWQLVVVEGYRHPFVQEREFLHQFAMLSRQYPTMDVEELEERAHQRVALPSVAGHPTGGAVDVSLADNGQEIDMGCAIADFNRPDALPTFAQGVAKSQHEHRLLLHGLMLEAGFAPFYGEWWHYSFGDREWAAFYGKSKTIYSPIYVI